MAKSTHFVEIDRKALAELITRVEEAIEHNLALSVDDLKLLLLAISTLCTLQEKIETDDVTLHKLRKLLGMVQQSERHLVSSQKTSDKKSKKTTQKKNVEAVYKAPLPEAVLEDGDAN